MGFLDIIFGQKQTEPRDAIRPLYTQIVAKAREPHWYIDGGIDDSVDGRFDMVATLLSLMLLRLETEEMHTKATVFLTEIFVDDMDAQLREFGVGDVIVGKHVGRIMGALGGRLGTLRDALAAGGDLPGFVERNMRCTEDAPVGGQDYLTTQLKLLADGLAAQESSALLSGQIRW